MKLVLTETGKSKEKAIKELIAEYTKRIRRFNPIEVHTLKEGRLPKGSGGEEVSRLEAEYLLKYLTPDDHVVLLDEKGKQMSSRSFAAFIKNRLLLPKTRLVFVIGGAYGFHKTVYERADETISLSSMTISHQIIRPIFMEQLYRAFTIINHHPYHND